MFWSRARTRDSSLYPFRFWFRNSIIHAVPTPSYDRPIPRGFLLYIRSTPTMIQRSHIYTSAPRGTPRAIRRVLCDARARTFFSLHVRGAMLTFLRGSCGSKNIMSNEGRVRAQIARARERERESLNFQDWSRGFVRNSRVCTYIYAPLRRGYLLHRKKSYKKRGARGCFCTSAARLCVYTRCVWNMSVQSHKGERALCNPWKTSCFL